MEESVSLWKGACPCGRGTSLWEEVMPCEEEFLGGRNLCVLVGEGVSLRRPDTREEACCCRWYVLVGAGKL